MEMIGLGRVSVFAYEQKRERERKWKKEEKKGEKETKQRQFTCVIYRHYYKYSPLMFAEELTEQTKN